MMTFAILAAGGKKSQRNERVCVRVKNYTDHDELDEGFDVFITALCVRGTQIILFSYGVGR